MSTLTFNDHLCVDFVNLARGAISPCGLRVVTLPDELISCATTITPGMVADTAERRSSMNMRFSQYPAAVPIAALRPIRRGRLPIGRTQSVPLPTCPTSRSCRFGATERWRVSLSKQRSVLCRVLYQPRLRRDRLPRRIQPTIVRFATRNARGLRGA